MSEFELIALFTAPFRPAPSPRGPGDDCAVLPPSRGPQCVTTDSVVEGVHFRLGPFSWADVGHKALAVNLSDLAAMGATPQWFVCAVALPPGGTAAQVTALARGMSALARKHRIALVGGNFTRAAQLGVTLTAAGTCRHPLLRSGGRPGDLLYVSGTLGSARLGLEDLARGRGRTFAAQAQRRPEPRVRLGQLASHHARAAIDLSDGLAQDLGHLCRASRVGARVEVARVPLHPGLTRAKGSRASGWALAGGEDYQLLLAVPPERSARFERACREAGEAVTRIGALTPGRQLRFLGPAGTPVKGPRGWDHFR